MREDIYEGGEITHIKYFYSCGRVRLEFFNYRREMTSNEQAVNVSNSAAACRTTSYGSEGEIVKYFGCGEV